MASPFKAFRKHQKAMIAVLALLAMFAFVVLPIVLQGMGGRAVQNPVVVTTTSYGDIKEFTLRGMQRNRQALIAFFGRLAQSVAMAGGHPAMVRMIQSVVGPASEEDVVRTWLLAKRAEQLGLVVSNQTINQFLQGVTTGPDMSTGQVRQLVTLGEVTGILQRLGLSQNQLFELLRHEILARQIEQLFLISLGGQRLLGTTPAQRWDYYQRLNRQAKIEVVGVPVSRFLGDVEAPPEQTLREFFEQYKEVPDVPTSPGPGFLEPHRIAVEYLKADHERLTEIVTISDEEVRQYYEQFKDEKYRKMREREPAATPDQADAPAETGAEGKPSGEATDPEPKQTPETSSVDARPAFHLASFTQEGVPKERDAEAEPTVVKDAKNAKDEAEAEREPPKAEDEIGPELPGVSEQAGPELPAAKEDAGPESPAAGEEAGADEPAVEEVRYVPLEEVEGEIRRRLAEAEIQQVLERLRDTMGRYYEDWIVYESSLPEEKQRQAPPEKPELRRLAKENRLSAHRTALISEFEAEQLDIGKSQLEDNISFTRHAFERSQEYQPAISQDTEGNYYLFWKVQDVEQRVSDFEDEGVRERVLGKWKEIQARGLARKEAERLAAEARKKVASVTEQARKKEQEANRLEEEARQSEKVSEPSTAETRKEAERRAAELREEAEALWAEAGKAFRDAFADEPGMVVTESESFSWVTYGTYLARWSPVPPRISEIKARTENPGAGEEPQRDAVVMPGNDFMREVFSLEVGEIGVAMNQPETVAYVVRVTEVNPLPEVLWRIFRTAAYDEYFRVATDDMAKVREAWLSGMESAVGFQWKRAPHRDPRTQ